MHLATYPEYDADLALSTQAAPMYCEVTLKCFGTAYVHAGSLRCGQMSQNVLTEVEPDL